MSYRKWAVAAIAVAALGVAGCNDANQKDVKNVPPTLPTSGEIKVFANIDQHANFVRVCADGIAFITTTRDAMPINRLPEWDWTCAKPPGYVPYKGTPTNLLSGQVTINRSSGS